MNPRSPVALILAGVLCGSHLHAAGWYASLDAGMSWAGTLDQVGSNEDTVCYPTATCTGPVPGYRWRYDLATGQGNVFGVSAGGNFGSWGFSVSLARVRVDLEQRFKSIEYLDGSRIPPGTGSADVAFSIDGVATRVASVNVHRWFFRRASFAGYAGVGIGLAAATVEGIRFSARYEDPDYDAVQDDDISGIAWAPSAHAGVVHRSGIGLRATCSRTGAISGTGKYQKHPMHETNPFFHNENTVSASRGCSVSVGFTVPIGRQATVY